MEMSSEIKSGITKMAEMISEKKLETTAMMEMFSEIHRKTLKLQKWIPEQKHGWQERRKQFLKWEQQW